MIDIENQTVTIEDVTESILRWEVWWVSEEGTFPTFAEVKNAKVKTPIAVACTEHLFAIYFHDAA